MRAALLALAACNPSWDGTWSDGVHAPLIARSCGDDAYVVFSFDDKSYAAELLDARDATPFFDTGHTLWSGSLRLGDDQLLVMIDNNQFTATRSASIDDDAGDCATLQQ